MNHTLTVVNLHKSMSHNNREQRSMLIQEIDHSIGVLLRNFSNQRFETLSVWIGLTPGWHLEAVIKNLPQRKTVAIKCENVKSLKTYLLCILREGIHSIKTREEDQIFYFYSLDDQLSMDKHNKHEKTA